MKKFSFILIVAVAAMIGMSTTSCNDDTPVQPKTTPTDTTTEEEVELANRVRVGLKDYSIVEEAARTNATYNAAKDETAIIVFGSDETHGLIDFQITFSGKMNGTYSSSDKSLEFGLGTGEGNKRQEHNAGTTELTVTVTEFGEVGEKVKGTFSGEVKNTNGQTVQITNGIFEVVRKADAL